MLVNNERWTPVFHDALLGHKLQIQLPSPEVEILEAVEAAWLGAELVAGVGEGQLGRSGAETHDQDAPRPCVCAQVLQFMSKVY
jgi:hypothetical protein